MLSAVVLTENSSENLEKCLQSLRFVDELIIVVDDESADKARMVAQRFGAKFFNRKLAGDFSAQRNFGLKKAKGEWVLFVDSDERVSKDLRDEIEIKLKEVDEDIVGFYLKRRDKFLGRWLDHGETAAVRLLRLARKNVGKWQGKIHETWEVKGETRALTHPLLHERQLGLSGFLDRLTGYARLTAKDLHERQEKESYWRLLVNPLGKFFRNYCLKLGFLDGLPGLAMAWLMSWHSLLVRIWLKLFWRNDGQEVFKVNPKSWR